MADPGRLKIYAGAVSGWVYAGYGASGYSGSVAFTGAGVTTLLGSATEVTSTLEVQCNTGSGYQTYLQIPCTLRAQVTNP